MVLLQQASASLDLKVLHKYCIIIIIVINIVFKISQHLQKHLLTKWWRDWCSLHKN